MAEEIELTSDRETITGTVPYQPRLTMRVNRKIRVRVGYYTIRPRVIIFALLAVAGLGWAAWRLLGGTR